MIGWIIWGTGGNAIDLGVVEHKHCEFCEKERPFKIFVQYRYAHIYWLFSWITQKQYLYLCDICGRGHQLDAKEVEKTLDKNPIPLIRRWGWALLIAPIALLFLIGFISAFFK